MNERFSEKSQQKRAIKPFPLAIKTLELMAAL